MRGQKLDAILLGPRRRRRAMMRRLRELDRIDAGRSRRPFFGRLLIRVVPAVATIVIVMLGGVVILEDEFGYDVSREGVSRPAPLGTPAPAPAGEGGFVFSVTQHGNDAAPVAYSPCEVLRYVVNDDLAPPASDSLVSEAIAEVSALTGLKFSFEGATDAKPSGGVRARTGGPILIAWTTPEEVPDLAGNVAGLGGSTAQWHGVGSVGRYVSGEVALDAPQLTRLLQRGGGRHLARAIVMHELGHLVGLDHVDDPSQLMHRRNSGVLKFGDGDRRGLALLGGGACIPN